MTDIADLINQITNDNFSQAQVSFADIMNTKIGDALDQEKIAVAPSVFGDKSEESETEGELNNEEELELQDDSEEEFDETEIDDITDQEIEDFLDEIEPEE